MKQQLKVLFVLPSLKRAGAENQVVQLVNGLSNERFEKHLAVFEPVFDLREQLDETHVRFCHLPRRSRFDQSLARRIADLVDEFEIDVIHCTLQIAVLLGWRARGMARRNPLVVAAIHTTINRGVKEELYDRLVYRWALAGSDKIVFVCKAQADYWAKRYAFVADKAIVVYNGVEPEEFLPSRFTEAGAELRESLDVPADAGVVSCIAGFRVEKNHRGLVDAFAQLPESSYLMLAGRGELEQEVRHYVADKGLGPRVRFIGEVSDVRPLLAASNVTVLASFAVETFSMAMLESMSMAVPVVVTEIGGMAEAVVSGETGFVVPPRDGDALAAALKQCIADPARLQAMGEAARQRVAELFSREAMVAQTAAMMEQLAAPVSETGNP